MTGARRGERRWARAGALVGALALAGALGGCGGCPREACGAARPAALPAAPPLPPPPLPPPSRPPLEVRGGEHLAGLHPALERRARLLYERAEEEGVQLRFISGYRPYQLKAGGRRAGRGGAAGAVASWHNFGLAFDVNLQGRAGLGDALKHLREDEARWARVGALAADLGLTWGKQWGQEEIFHFEWHPGQPDAIRAPTLNALKASAEGGDLRAGYRGAWRALQSREGAGDRAEEVSR
ncbi:MAG: M15 family metallopeptidase [Deltaproteobacteria bacterium]|nr:M15 family metallopeptidase [Deltaproteobacteria bacterium]